MLTISSLDTAPKPVLKRLTTAAAFAFLTTAVWLSPLPVQALDDTDKAKVEQIVREYLLKNPEMLMEMQTALQEKQRREALEKAQLALANDKERIFNSKHQIAIGNPEGDVTVVEFFDYNCGFCQRALADMEKILDNDKNVRFVLKEMPILSEASVEAHRVSEAVISLAPERYREFHRNLMSLRGEKNGSRALEVASAMGIDRDALEKQARTSKADEGFNEVSEIARNLGINGTPSYVVGDEVVFGALGYDVLATKIANMRECGKATCS